jgi:hypothetical protein
MLPKTTVRAQQKTTKGAAHNNACLAAGVQSMHGTMALQALCRWYHRSRRPLPGRCGDASRVC